MAVIYHFGMTKQELFEAAKQLVLEFIRFNNIEEPLICTGYIRGLYGHYWAGSTKVDVERTVLPTLTRSRRWSYPGHKSDVTAAGVLCHEIGHHISAHLGKKGWDPHITKPVSSYEPDREEAFAETMRLFILNPDLLRLARPERFFYLCYQLRLRPCHTTSWREVLHNAPEHIIQAATKFAIGGHVHEEV